MSVVRCCLSPDPLPGSLHLRLCSHAVWRCGKMKNGKTPGAGEHRGRQTRCKQPGQVQLRFCREEGDEWHEPEGRGEPGTGRENGQILHPARSCEGALMPSGAQGCSGESQWLCWEALGERGKEKQVLHRQRRGAPRWFSRRSPDRCAGDTGDAPSCRGCVSKPGLAQPRSEGPALKS